MVLSGITRRSAFWIVFTIASLACGVLAWRYFPAAMPLTALDVRMSRAQALDEGMALAQLLSLAPANARAAVSFGHDTATQNFVELDAGGNAQFTALLDSPYYSPYWWEVRVFAPGETAEARIRFRPDGGRDGFVQQVPESRPGPALDADAARSIAEARARADWNVDFNGYRLVEHSQETQRNGRVDHHFVYEREAPTLGEGRFRLGLNVSGDAFSGLGRYVQVPEAFERRFASMRSANNQIAKVAALAVALLYGLGGCVVGGLWLLRKHALRWPPALVAGAVVAALNAAALLANAPQAWMGFDTAQSEWTFWGQQIGASLLILIGGTLGLALVFMAAEGLSRLAFPDHPQLWRVASVDAAPTPAVLGRTLGGYLAVPIELAFIVGFYFVTNHYLGWWQPSESLSDPNILGSALPALSPIGMALQAGTMEECLFRAVPLSIAALIGERFGARRLLLGITLVLQAVVFGAGHANYPGFPAYSRLVELIVPAFIWGLVFLRFGLVPTIILHTLFDLTLMSLPVFLVAGVAARLNAALVVLAAVLPIVVVLVQRVRAGGWRELAPALRNVGWQRAAGVSAATVAGGRAEAGRWTLTVQRILPILAIAGIVAFVAAGEFRADAPPLAMGRDAAESVADAALAERGVKLASDWRRMSSVRAAPNDPSIWIYHTFIWQQAGPAAYARLMGNWLSPPLWEVRYARFDVGDVAARAEEWRVTIDGEGRVRQVRHVLPEDRPGASLDEAAARPIASAALEQRFGLSPASLRDVSAEQTHRPARNDWSFTWADPAVDVGSGGQARAVISLAGDEVVGYGRYVFVPEDWQRNERARAGRVRIARMALGLVAALVAVAALIAAIVAWNRGRFDRRAFVRAVLAMALASLLALLDRWPAAQASFNTTESFASQATLWAAAGILGALVMPLLAAMFAGVAAWAARTGSLATASTRELLLRGACCGLLVVGVDALVAALSARKTPRWPELADRNAWFPYLAAVVDPVLPMLATIAVTILILHWLDRFTSGWQRRRLIAFIALVMVAGAQSAFAADSAWTIVAGALAIGAVDTLIYAAVLRFDLRAVPGFVAAQIVASVVQDALLQRTAGAYASAAIAVAVVVLLAWAGTRELARPAPVPAPAL